MLHARPFNAMYRDPTAPIDTLKARLPAWPQTSRDAPVALTPSHGAKQEDP